MIKAIIFDLSEVCIRGIKNFEKIIAREIKREEKEIEKALKGEKLIKLFEGKISEEEYWRKFQKEIKEELNLTRLKKQVRDYFEIAEYSKTHEIISKIKSKKIPLFLLSDHAKEWIEHISNSNEFLNLFNKKFYSFEIKGTKKSKESFKKVLKEINFQGEEVLFIDDSKKNIQVAKEAGIKNIELFTTAENLEKILTKKYKLI